MICPECNEFTAGSVLPPLGHDYQNGVCVRCGAIDPTLPPAFTAPAGPQEIAVLEGEQGTLSVTATNAANYQWYVDRGDSQGYVPIPGATETTYTTSAVKLENNGYSYYCEATNAHGTARSAVFTLRVTEAIALPQTGDGSHPGLWLLLMAASLCGLGVLMRTVRRRETR